MGVFDDLKKGLQDAIEFEQCGKQLKTKLVKEQSFFSGENQACSNKPSISHEEIDSRLTIDTEFREESEMAGILNWVRVQMINSRSELNVSREELAGRVGTTKAVISRFENGNLNPSLDFISKLAHGLSKEIKISIK